MRAPLFCLMLASLLSAPALGASDQFQRFHTHAVDAGNRSGHVNPNNVQVRIPPFDCNVHMRRLQGSAVVCKPFNHVIMGDTTAQTVIADVDAICSHARARTLDGNNYKSVKVFNLRSCRLNRISTSPPNCVYDEEGLTGRIVVSCGPHGPSHLVTIEPNRPQRS